MELDALITAMVAGVFSLAGIWFAYYLNSRKPPHAEPEPAFGLQSSLSFASIKVDEDAPFFREQSSPKLYPFESECSAYFEIEKIITNSDVAFDVTLLNSTGGVAIISEIGVRISVVAEIEIVPLGEPSSFSVEKEASFTLEIPDIYSSLGHRLGLQVTNRLLSHVKAKGLGAWRRFALRRLSGRLYQGIKTYDYLERVHSAVGRRAMKNELLSTNELLSMSATCLPVDIVIAGKLPDPQYLSEDASYRFSMTLLDYAKHMPNCSAINIYVKTNKGLCFSEPVFISFMTVRNVGEMGSKVNQLGTKLQGVRLVSRVEEVAPPDRVAEQLIAVLDKDPQTGQFVVARPLDGLRAMLEEMNEVRRVEAMKQIAAFAYHLKSEQQSEAAATEIMDTLNEIAKVAGRSSSSA